MAHSKPGMTPVLYITGRTTEAENEKIAQALLGSREIVGWIDRAQNVVVGNLAVKSTDQAAKTVLSNDAVNFVLFHDRESSTCVYLN